MQELIELGANNIIVPGLLADGCLPITLTTFMSSNPKDYNLKTGCLDWLNNFAQFHNQYLRAELKRIRHRHPHAVVFYADYFNAALRLYSSPEQYGNFSIFEFFLLQNKNSDEEIPYIYACFLITFKIFYILFLYIFK